MEALVNFLINSFGLTREQQRLIMRTAWFGIVSGHILWVCGLFATFGIPGPFARAAEMKQLAEDLRSDRIDRLDHDILNLRIQQCKATTPEAKREYGERLQELESKYFSIVGRSPRVPGCDEV